MFKENRGVGYLEYASEMSAKKNTNFKKRIGIQNARKLRIAIIDENTVTCIGLRSLLSEVVPFAELCIYGSFDEFMKDNLKICFHYFISSSVCFSTTVTLSPGRKKKTIVMASGVRYKQYYEKFRILDLSQPGRELCKSQY